MTSKFKLEWESAAHAINGTTGCHYDLATWVESKGFDVRPDHEDNERSEIGRPGTSDWCDKLVGEIIGDDEAVVRIFSNHTTTRAKQ